MRALVDPYGSFLPALVYHDIRDRLLGRSASANARWGWLSRPARAGKLIWISSGASRNSIRLGIELALAITAERSDVAIVLAFESEFPELVAPLERPVRIRWGYGRADYVGSMDRILAWE